MLKVKGLKRRWIINTVSVVCALGVVCVLVVTAAFSAYYYSAMESDLRLRAKTTTEFFADYQNQSYNAYYQSVRLDESIEPGSRITVWLTLPQFSSFW